MRPEFSCSTGTNSEKRVSQIPPTVLRGWQVTAGPLRQTPLPAGFSGGRVFRIDSPDRGRTFAIKASPPMDRSEAPGWEHRLETICELLTNAAPHHPLLTPPLRTRQNRWGIWYGSRYWQCLPWVAGNPLPRHADRSEIMAGAKAIAEMHVTMSEAVRDALPTGRVRPQGDGQTEQSSPAPALIIKPPSGAKDRLRNQAERSVPRSIRQRIRRLDELQHQRGSISRPIPDRVALADCLSHRVFGQTSPLADRLAVAIDSLRSPENGRLIGHLRHRLAEHSRHDWKQELQWVLRDIHREHLHFFGRQANFDTNRSATRGSANGSLAGIVDFDAIGIDHVATDLARWASDFADQPLQATVAGYREVRPLSELSAKLAADLLHAGTVAAVANWTQWLVWEKRSFPVDAAMIRDRLDHLIESVSRIC